MESPQLRGPEQLPWPCASVSLFIIHGAVVELPLGEVVNLKYNMRRDSEPCLEHAKGSVNIGGGLLLLRLKEERVTRRIIEIPTAWQGPEVSGPSSTTAA